MMAIYVSLINSEESRIEKSEFKMEAKIKNERREFRQAFEKRLVHFTVAVLKMCNTLREDRNLWAVADQVARSAASIGANVSEAKGSGSVRGYKSYFEIALRSANETKYWFTVLAEYQIGENADLQKLQSELQEIIGILHASVLTMKGKKNISNS